MAKQKVSFHRRLLTRGVVTKQDFLQLLPSFRGEKYFALSIALLLEELRKYPGILKINDTLFIATEITECEDSLEVYGQDLARFLNGETKPCYYVFAKAKTVVKEYTNWFWANYKLAGTKAIQVLNGELNGN